MLSKRLRTLGAAAVLLSVSGGGLVLMGRGETRKPASSLSAPFDKKSSIPEQPTHLYGDLSPDSAKMRLGTLERRAVMAQLAVSPDGRAIITVRGGKHIHVWDAATGRLLRRRELLLDSSGSLSALSHDGRWLATGRWRRDSKLTIWDVRSGEKARELILTDADALDLCAFAPDGERLVTIGHRGENHIVRVWNLAEGKTVFRKVVRAAGSHLAAIAPDGKRVLAQFPLREGGVLVYCWEIDSGRQLWRSNEFRVDLTTFLPGDKLLAWCPKPLPVDLATGRPAEITLPPSVREHSRMVFSPDGRTLLMSDLTAYGDVTVWDWREVKELRVLKGVGEAVFMPDGKSVISNNGSLQRWDLASGQAAWPDTFELGHTNAVIAVEFTADGRRLVSGSSDGSVRLWDVETGKQLAIWGGYARPPGLAGGPWTAFDLTLTSDGERLLSKTQDGNLQLRVTRTGECLRSFSLPRTDVAPPGNWPLYHVRLSLDGTKVFALAGSEFFCGSSYLIGAGIPTNWFVVWDLKTGRLLRSRPVPWEAGAISPDGRQVLLANGILLDAETGKEIARMEGMSDRYPSAFSTDGALIYSDLIPDGVRMWETATGKTVAHSRSKASRDPANSLPDSTFYSFISVFSDARDVKVCDLLDGKFAASREHRMAEEISSPLMGYCLLTPRYASSRDGRRLAAGLSDSTILLWDLPAARTKQRRLQTKDLESLWSDLADSDAAKAWRAVRRMSEGSNETLSFLRERMKPYPAAPTEETRKLLNDLDSDSFVHRETAMKGLKELGLRAESALREALRTQPSLEQRRRIELLLTALPRTPPPLSMEELRQLRALIVLECLGLPEASRLLEEMAKGPESSRLTRQARAALACIR